MKSSTTAQTRAIHPEGDGARQLAAACAESLCRRLVHARVSVYRYDSVSQTLHLLAAVPGEEEGAAVGERSLLQEGLLSRAVRSGETRQELNAFGNPDLLRGRPGAVGSELVVPIRERGDSGAVLGALRLEYAPPHHPDAEAQAAAELLAPPLAAAMRGGGAPAVPAAVRSADLARRLAEADILSAVAHHVSRSGDGDAVMRRIVEAARELVPSGSALLLLRHPDRQMLEVAAVSGAAPLRVGDPVGLEETVAGAVLSESRVRSVRGGEAARAFGGEDAAHAIRNALLVPLSSAGAPFGVLAVVGRETGDEYQPEDVEPLQRLADHAGAVHAARTLASLRQRLSDASLIAEVGRSVTGTLGLDEVLALIVQAAQMLTNAESAAVGLLSSETARFVLKATAGGLMMRQGAELPADGSLMGWTAAAGETVVTASLAADPRSCPLEAEPGPAVLVPLEVRGRVRGVLLVSCAARALPPSDDDLEALRKLAAYASIALDNARLYEEQQQLSRALRAQADELEKAYAELHTSQDRLVVSEKMAALGRVTAGIAHEINSPLGGILNYLQIARDYVEEYHASAGDPEVSADDHRAIAGDLRDSLSLAQEAAHRVAQFVRTIKGQTRVGEGIVQTFDPVREIESTLILYQHQLRTRRVQVHSELAPSRPLVGDPGKFAVIVQNLLSNAIDAYQGAEGEIRLRLAHEGTALVLEVEDRGCGIPEEIQPRIFDYMFTTKDVGQGTGLGLSMVHDIVTSHFRGEVHVRSRVGSGTTFIVRFPDAGADD